tara:strand:- start:848 stop:1177 length:330 start_codon:yes stop_codon:yes gene_type:complete
MDALISFVETTLNQVLANPWFFAAITLTFKMYAGMARPTPPAALAALMENVFFRIFVWFLVLFIGSRNVLLSLIVSSAMTLGLDAMEPKESFENNFMEELRQKYKNLLA